jgi:DNA primase
MSFDSIKYLQDRGINYFTSGRNVSRGWVNIECPFCGDHDYSGNNHLGISPQERFSCWICGERGGIVKLIRELEEVEWREAFRIAERFSDLDPIPVEKGRKRASSLKIPIEITSQPLKRHIKYLRERRFKPKETIKTYGLMFGQTFGHWRFRIIVPVFLRGEMVSFIGADATRNFNTKYTNLPNEESIVPVRETVYNIDNVFGNKAFVTEGLLDTWRFGPKNVVGTLGTVFTPDQIRLLKNAGVDEYYILYDSGPEATKRAIKLAEYLSGFVPHAEVLELYEGDPADLKMKQVRQIKRMVGVDV